MIVLGLLAEALAQRLEHAPLGWEHLGFLGCARFQQALDPVVAQLRVFELAELRVFFG